MKLTKDYIINHIRETKYPCWSLYIVQNYRRIPHYFYNGEDWSDSETAESKAEKAAARLTAITADIPRDATLSIDLKSSRGANGERGTIGPLEFANHEKGDDVPQMSMQQGFGGFSFVQPPPGWISEETLNGKLEAIQAANERKINEILFKQKEDAFREQCRRERQELAEMRKELKDEKKKYESTTGAAAETLVFAVKKILTELFPNLPLAQAAAQPQLSGAASAADDDEPPSDPKYRAVETLANSLYENPDLSERDIAEIATAIKNRAHRPTAQTAPNEPTTTQYYTGEEDGDNV